MSELKPCPFCGGDAEMRTASGGVHGYTFGARVLCEPCGVNITREGSDLNSANIKAAAVAAWNTRTKGQDSE